jgi:hypothetical protein
MDGENNLEKDAKNSVSGPYGIRPIR